MADETLAQRIQNLRGKSLNAPEAAALWKELRAWTTDDASAMAWEGAAESTDRRIPPRHDPEPASLGDWVLVNRALRGASPQVIARSQLDQRDLDALQQPRCGLWRVARNFVPDDLADRLERREWFQASEVGWDRARLKLAVAPNSNPPPYIPREQYIQAIDRAIGSWNRAEVGIEIERVQGTGNVEILVQWSSPALDAHRLLSETVLAHADYPSPNMHLVSRPPIPICLNRVAFWAPEDAGGAVIASRYDIESFVLHELGHCLGLFHRSEGSVMYEVVKKGRHRILDTDSIRAAKDLYASRSDRIA